VDIGSSLFKTKLTSQDLDLILDLDKHAEVVHLDENVPAVFECCKQTQRLLEVATGPLWRLLWWRLHDRERSGQGR
jgi:hypothetical protein